MARLDLKQAEAKLRYLLSDAAKQKKRRAEKKTLVMQLAGENESNAAKLRKFTHSSTGRPPLEDISAPASSNCRFNKGRCWGRYETSH